MSRARASLLIAAAIAAGFAAAPARAGIERAGTTAANFLSYGSAPAVLGMGGAGLSLTGGLAAFDWNPATLARLQGTEAVFSHAALGDETAQEWGIVGSRLRFAGLTGAVSGLFQNEGSFEGRDALNNPTGTFEVSSMAVSAGLARPIGPFLTAGVGVKYASENLGGVRGSGVAIDAGLQVRSGGLGIGAAAQNAFGEMRYGSSSYDFPASYGFGVSYDHVESGVRVAMDMNFPAAYYPDIRGGVEWRWNDRLALRAGYRAEMRADANEPLAGPTFGMGAGARGMWFDYGYLVSAGQHRIGLTFHPGEVLSSDGPEHRDNAQGQAIPAQGTDTQASAKPRAAAPATSGATGSSAAASAAPQPSAPAGTTSRASSGTAPQTSAPASSSTRAPASAPSSASPPSPASTVAGSGVRAPAGAPTASKPGSSAPAGAGVAAGPVATQLSSAPAAPPSYTQRAKAARGTGEAAAGNRQGAALQPGSTAAQPVAPKAPAAPSAKPAATASGSPGPASATPASTAPASTAPAPAAVARPDTTAARPAAEPAKPRPAKVRVKNRQTMADIAREYGLSVPAIMMENNLTSDHVRPGQVLKLPRR